MHLSFENKFALVTGAGSWHGFGHGAGIRGGSSCGGVQAAVRLSPDVVVLDASMPILNGIDAAREIKKLRPATAIVFLSMHSNTIYLRKALEAARPAGADGSGSRCRKRRRPR